MNNEILYLDLIAGSRAYGLNIETSDVDRPQVSDHWDMYRIRDGFNLIRVPQEEFVKRATLQYDNAYYIQWWFPEQWLSENDLARYMQSERENYVSQRRKRVHDVLWNQAEGMWEHSDWLYPAHPKRLAYSTLFYAILGRYASGMPFAQAHRMDGELQEQLLAMRRNEISLEEAQALNRHWREKALAAESFYDAPEDGVYVQEVETQLRKLVGIE